MSEPIKTIGKKRNMSEPGVTKRPGSMPLEDLPRITESEAEEEPREHRLFAEKEEFLLSTVVEYRGRRITITGKAMTADRFCDLLDKRGFVPVTEETLVARREEERRQAPICKWHGPMKPSKAPGKFFCPAKMGDGSYCKEEA